MDTEGQARGDEGPMIMDTPGQKGAPMAVRTNELLQAANSDERRAEGYAPSDWSGTGPDGGIILGVGSGAWALVPRGQT